MTNKNTRRGFTQSCFSKGFTLIELLVVVLIIGILAAVAVPQYQFAVEKSRTSEALVQLNSLQRAIDSYLLENGYPESLESFLGNQTDGNGKLVIDVTGSLDCTVNDGQLCASRDFLYKSICDGEHNSCFLEAQRVLSGYEYTKSNTKYLLTLSKTQDTWTKTCYYIEENYPQGKKLCDSLQAQGWKSEEY